MDADDLRSRQSPLKRRYRADPASARVTSRAEGRVAAGDIACLVQGWAGEIDAGLHPATGGDGDQACSADMLLRALVACAGVTLSSVATAMGIDLRAARVVAEGDWDARGTLALDERAPVGLSAVRLAFDVDTDADQATLDRLLELTERYCVIYQTLTHPPQHSATIRRGS